MMTINKPCPAARSATGWCASLSTIFRLSQSRHNALVYASANTSTSLNYRLHTVRIDSSVQAALHISVKLGGGSL